MLAGFPLTLTGPLDELRRSAGHLDGLLHRLTEQSRRRRPPDRSYRRDAGADCVDCCSLIVRCPPADGRNRDLEATAGCCCWSCALPRQQQRRRAIPPRGYRSGPSHRRSPSKESPALTMGAVAKQ